MSKKKKELKFNNTPIGDSMLIDVERFNLPKTMGNPPKRIRQINDKAFDAIRPQIESLVEDNMLHAAKNMGVLVKSDATFLGYTALANLSQNGLIRAGVEMRANEMTRKWGELTRKGKTDNKDDLSELTEQMEKFDVKDLFRKAACMCGYLGGCLLFIDTGEDETRLADPLVLDNRTFKQGGLKRFKMIEPYFVTPGGYNSTEPLADDYFKPSIWYVQGKPIHASRLIYFSENELTSLLKPAYNFFGLPLAQRVLDAVAHFTENREAAGRLLQKYALTVLKTNMATVLQGGYDNDLKNRIMYFVQNRSNDGCAAIDKEQEDLVLQTTSLAGVTDMVRQSMEYVAAMFCEPVTKMWGLSPNGFSTGDAELKNHYDNISAQQKQIFGEAIKRVIRVLQINLYGKIDESIIFNFTPLEDDDERATAETNKIQVDTDTALINANIISAKEARQRLIDDENSGYNTLSTNIDNNTAILNEVQTALDLQVGGKFDKELKKKAAEVLLKDLGIKNIKAILKDIEEQADDKDYSDNEE